METITEIGDKKDKIDQVSVSTEKDETNFTTENSKFKSQTNDVKTTSTTKQMNLIEPDLKNHTSTSREKLDEKQKLDNHIETVLSNYFKNLTLNE